MKTDYTCLLFALKDMELYEELNTSYPPKMLVDVVQSLLEYLVDRDKPKRELILLEDNMKERIKGLKKEIKAKTSLRKQKALKKEVKKLGKLPVKKSAQKPRKGVRAVWM
jgi:hypothetical protein